MNQRASSNAGDRTSLWAALSKYSLAQKLQRSDAVCTRMSVIQEALDGRHSITFVEKRRATTGKASISVCRLPPRGHTTVLGGASNAKKIKSKAKKQVDDDGDASFKTSSDGDELTVEHRAQIKELVLELFNRGNVRELKKELKGVGDARSVPLYNVGCRALLTRFSQCPRNREEDQRGWADQGS